MKNITIVTVLICVISILSGCQEAQTKRQPQHPTTVKQMKQIADWSVRLEGLFKDIDNNLIYLRSRTLDPNDPNSLIIRIDKLESKGWW